MSLPTVYGKQFRDNDDDDDDDDPTENAATLMVQQSPYSRNKYMLGWVCVCECLHVCVNGRVCVNVYMYV